MKLLLITLAMSVALFSQGKKEKQIDIDFPRVSAEKLLSITGAGGAPPPSVKTITGTDTSTSYIINLDPNGYRVCWFTPPDGSIHCSPIMDFDKALYTSEKISKSWIKEVWDASIHQQFSR